MLRGPLLYIDAFSKYAWVEPMKTKMGEVVKEAFEKIWNKPRVENPPTYKPTMWRNSTIVSLQPWWNKGKKTFLDQCWCYSNIVGRFNRIFKERFYRYFTVKNTFGYLPVLPDLVKEYNASYHHTIGMAPNQVNFKNEKEVWDSRFGKRLSKTCRKGHWKYRIVWDLTGNFDVWRKDIYQDGPKKYLSCNVP